jgi:hypothetical protein
VPTLAPGPAALRVFTGEPDLRLLEPRLSSTKLAERRLHSLELGQRWLQPASVGGQPLRLLQDADVLDAGHAAEPSRAISSASRGGMGDHVGEKARVEVYPLGGAEWRI